MMKYAIKNIQKKWIVTSFCSYILLHLFPAWIFFRSDYFIETSKLFDKGNIAYIIFMIAISAFLVFHTKGSCKIEIFISALIYFIFHVLLVNKIIYMDLKEDYLSYIILFVLTLIACLLGLRIGNKISLIQKTA